jgi:acyl-CoA synthetase (AMP-forming)/AMP-acid ligase II
MAENTFAITQTRIGECPRRDRFEQAGRIVEMVTSGRAVDGTEIRIRTPTGLAIDREVGELEIRGPSLFTKYDGAATDAVAGDGWFRTGDLGYAVDGDYFVTGRSKDLIIHRGVNLHPEDIEEVIGEIPGCKPGRVVVFGVLDDVADTEEIVVMVETAGDIPAAVLAVPVRARVYEQFGCVPSKIVVVAPGTLLKSTSGKPSRSANRAQYLHQRGGSPT